MSIYFFKYKENNTFLDGKIRKRKKRSQDFNLSFLFLLLILHYFKLVEGKEHIIVIFVFFHVIL